MTRIALLAALSIGLATPAFAQHTDHEAPPAPSAKQPPAAAPEKPPSPPADHHNHDAKPVADAADPPTGQLMETELVDPPEAGNDVPPAAPKDFAADAYYPRGDMDRARRILDEEHGGTLQSKVMANLFEYQSVKEEGGYRWEGEGWFGGDIDRLVIKSEGEGNRDRVEAGEVQALYSHAVGPYTDLQVGLRQNIEPHSRTYLAFGFETLLPYWFETQGTVFVGERGQVLGRLEGDHDFLVTQRLVLQPRAELNFAAKDDVASGIGSGLSNAELGLRLRYEFQREFAPYVGISWERSFGGAADYTRAAGERVEKTSFVVGLRAWY